ncbi:ADP-ribose glycohydrolase MACROD2-like isoform X2 [Mobula hypostoma]
MLARENNLRTIAFPCVSTGIYGYPNGQAAETVLKTVRRYLEEHRDSFDRIIFCVYLKIDYTLYKEKLPFYFPFESVSPGSSKEKSKTAEEDKEQSKDKLNLGDKQETVSPGSSKEKPKTAEEEEKQSKNMLDLGDNQGAKTPSQL